MSIQISSSSNASSQVVQTPRSSTAVSQANVKEEQEQVTLSGDKAESLTYSKPRVAPENLAGMLEESNRKVDELMNLIRPLMEQQGLSLAKLSTGEQKLTVDQGTIDAAKAAISEDGEFGVRKVAERILSFAKFAMGDDPAQMKKIRDAVELGFSQAKEALGGQLPEISQKTYDTIMAEFDRWETEGIPAGDTVSLKKSDVSTSRQS